jgi:hypothetical protein
MIYELCQRMVHPIELDFYGTPIQTCLGFQRIFDLLNLGHTPFMQILDFYGNDPR